MAVTNEVAMGKRGGGAAPGQGSAKVIKGDRNSLLNANPYAPLAGGSGGTTVEKRIKLPPIFTPVKEIAKLMEAMNKAKLHPNYKLCSTGTKILCCTEELFNGVKSFFKQAKIEFYTHDVAAAKPMKVVIRGLPAREKPENIMDELVKVHKLKPVAVFEMTRQNKEINYRDSLYLIHLERGSATLAELKKIKAIAHIVVEWEMYRPQHREVTQCKNCQAFGHGTKNCAMAPKCPKCAGPHCEVDCEAEMDDETAVKCVNCGNNHPASDKACPKRAEFMLIRKKASTRNQPNRSNRGKSLTNDDENFPEIPRRPIPVLEPLPLPGKNPAGKPPGTPKPPPPGWGNPGGSKQQPLQQQPEEKLFSKDELLDIFDVMIEKMCRCRTRVEQLRTLGRFIIQYGH